MKWGFLLTVIFGLAVLFVYSALERRINQRACKECGFRASIDAVERAVPPMRCGLRVMKKILANWPRLVFILLPLSIATVDAAVLISEALETEPAHAIRLVRESRSRKENFTVQQYLYTTVYYRKEKGEAVVIHGWRAEQPSGPETPVTVVFSYSDSKGEHVATWEADLISGDVMPQDEAASNLSWY